MSWAEQNQQTTEEWLELIINEVDTEINTQEEYKWNNKNKLTG